MGIIKTLGWAIWLFGYLIGRLPAYWRCRHYAKKGQTEQHDAIVQKQVDLWTSKLLHHIKMDVAVEGLENLPKDEVVVFASNHQSFLDIPVLLASIRPICPIMAKKGLDSVPFLSGWMREIGCLFVDRSDARAAMAVLKEGEESLKGGKSLIIFPEGTRSVSDTVGEFKPGVMRIALKAKVRIVPVVVDGTYRALEGNGYKVRPVKVKLKFLPAVETASLTREEQKQLPAKLEDIIRMAKDA